MHRALTLTTLLFAPTLALAGGGAGGVTIDGMYFPRYGAKDSPHEAPGLMGCLGGVGFGVLGKGFRFGGDGQYCRGRDGVSLASGGLQLGSWKKTGPVYWSFYMGLGGGVFNDRTAPDADYAAIFGYAKPTFAVGLPFGPFAIEAGLYGNFPINFVQVVGVGQPRGFINPQVGAKVSFLFGNLRGDRPRPAVEPVRIQTQPMPAPQPVYPTQPTIPELPTPYDPCPQGPDSGPDCVEEASERPLAIPADPPPPAPY